MKFEEFVFKCEKDVVLKECLGIFCEYFVEMEWEFVEFEVCWVCEC